MNSEKPADIRETISALVDGETSDWELRKALQQTNEDTAESSEIRESWAAYQAIGSALRKEPVSGIDISSAVMEAIEQEEAPSRFSSFKSSVVGRAFGQTAIAASVAVVALLGIQQYQLAQNDVSSDAVIAEAPQQEVPAVVLPPAGFEIQPVTRAVSSTGTESTLRPGTSIQIPVDKDQIQAHLDELVQEHSEHSVNSSQQVIPMVRVPASSSAE